MKTKLKLPTCRVCQQPKPFKDLTTVRGTAKDGILQLVYECRKHCEPPAPAEPAGVALPAASTKVGVLVE